MSKQVKVIVFKTMMKILKDTFVFIKVSFVLFFQLIEMMRSFLVLVVVVIICPRGKEPLVFLTKIIIIIII